MSDKPQATILLVDDRESNRYAVRRILQKAGYNVLEADTGEEALRLAEGRPDIVILDINLPDVSGLEVCRQLKAAPATAAVPVLHLSASMVGSEARSEGLEGGADPDVTNFRAMNRRRKAITDEINRMYEKGGGDTRRWRAKFDALNRVALLFHDRFSLREGLFVALVPIHISLSIGKVVLPRSIAKNVRFVAEERFPVEHH